MTRSLDAMRDIVAASGDFIARHAATAFLHRQAWRITRRH
jgi:hypothetical protein